MIIHRFVLATTTAVALTGGAWALAVPAQASDTGGSHLVGRWVGHFHGYDGGVFEKGQEKIVITKSKGNAAYGTWQWRFDGGHWSAPEPASFVVMPLRAGIFDVLGADGNGAYEGLLRGNDEWVMSYVGSSPTLQGLYMRLTKRS